MEYKIEKAENGWDIFQSDPPTARYQGKRFVTHAKGAYENALAKLFERLNSNRALRDAIERHGGLVHPPPTAKPYDDDLWECWNCGTLTRDEVRQVERDECCIEACQYCNADAHSIQYDKTPRKAI